MSRTNPCKRKKRYAKKTLLILGEGSDEEMFLKHLRSLYSFKSGVKVTIRKGKGGSLPDLVICTSKVPGAFDRRVIVVDNDKSKKEMAKARQEARKRDIELIEHTPCLDSVLLSILGKNTKGRTSKWCKNKFESDYMDDKKRRELNEYCKIFPKKLLNSKRKEILELEKLILMMKG